MGKIDDDVSLATPDTINFTTEQRIEFLANLIVNRITEDMAEGFALLQSIKAAE